MKFLQTSGKNAIETTDLTRSFGWDSSDSWTQHDVQELCRVMFDALEHKFRKTEQADLINRLYQGKMIDYVKCMECGKENIREDTFLDIPLPIRPFGKETAYGSVVGVTRSGAEPELTFVMIGRGVDGICGARDFGRSKSIRLRKLQQEMRRQERAQVRQRAVPADSAPDAL